MSLYTIRKESECRWPKNCPWIIDAYFLINLRYLKLFFSEYVVCPFGMRPICLSSLPGAMWPTIYTCEAEKNEKEIWLDAATTKLSFEIIRVMWFVRWTGPSLPKILQWHLKWFSRYLGLLTGVSPLFNVVRLNAGPRMKNQTRVSPHSLNVNLSIFHFRNPPLRFFQCRLFSMLNKSHFVISSSLSFSIERI